MSQLLSDTRMMTRDHYSKILDLILKSASPIWASLTWFNLLLVVWFLNYACFKSQKGLENNQLASLV